MSTCASCGAENRDGARFCSECGIPAALETGGASKQVLPPLPDAPAVAEIDVEGADRPTKTRAAASQTKQRVAVDASLTGVGPTPERTGERAVDHSDDDGGGGGRNRRKVVLLGLAGVLALAIVGGAIALSGGGDPDAGGSGTAGAGTGSTDDAESESFEPEALTDAASDGVVSEPGGAEATDDSDLYPWYVGVEIPDGGSESGSGHDELESLSRPDVPSSGTIFLSAIVEGTCWVPTPDDNEFEAVPCGSDFYGITFEIFEAEGLTYAEAPDLTLDRCITTFAEQGLPGIDVEIESSGPTRGQWAEGQRTVRCSAVPLAPRT